MAKASAGAPSPARTKKQPLLHNKARAGITHFRSGQAQEMGFPIARESLPGVPEGRLRQCRRRQRQRFLFLLL